MLNILGEIIYKDNKNEFYQDNKQKNSILKESSEVIEYLLLPNVSKRIQKLKEKYKESLYDQFESIADSIDKYGGEDKQVLVQNFQEVLDVLLSKTETIHIKTSGLLKAKIGLFTLLLMASLCFVIVSTTPLASTLFPTVSITYFEPLYWWIILIVTLITGPVSAYLLTVYTQNKFLHFLLITIIILFGLLNIYFFVNFHTFYGPYIYNYIFLIYGLGLLFLPFGLIRKK